MIEDPLSVLRPFVLSWNLRNSLPDSADFDEPGVIGACLGEQPIDGWKPYYLEVPRDGHKKDLTGRLNSASGLRALKTEWNRKRVINLPVYAHAQDYDIERLKIIIKNWCDISIPDDIPCIAVAVKCRGFYSDYREAQYVTTLTVWNDAVARIVSLDWFEGPLEDCITPEWYGENTPLLSLKNAVNKIQNIYENLNWDNKRFSIYALPQCLGSCLQGDKAKASYNPWNCKWEYANYADFKPDLSLLLSRIQGIFSEDRQEVEIYG